MALRRAYEIVKALPDPRRQLPLLGGLQIIRWRAHDYEGALELAQDGMVVAGRHLDGEAAMQTEWTLGVCHHLCGDQALAERYLASAVGTPRTAPGGRRIGTFGFDHRCRALVARARALWLRGYPERASEAAHTAIETARRLEHPVRLCIAQIFAASVFLWSGDRAIAAAIVDELIGYARDHMPIYKDIGLAFRDILAAQDDEAADLDGLRRSLGSLIGRHHIFVPTCRTALAECLLARGQALDAAKVMDVTVDNPEEALAEEMGARMVSVDAPEVLRVKGAVIAALGHSVAAEALALRAIEHARRQSALAWELRSAITLTRLQQVGSPREQKVSGAGMLAEVYERFTEGFETADLATARSLLKGTD